MSHTYKGCGHPESISRTVVYPVSSNRTFLRRRRNFMIPTCITFAAPDLTIDRIFPFPQRTHYLTFLATCLIRQLPLFSQPSQIIILLSQKKCITIPRIGKSSKLLSIGFSIFFRIAACHYLANVENL